MLSIELKERKKERKEEKKKNKEDIGICVVAYKLC
jgi:hypothetical protein